MSGRRYFVIRRDTGTEFSVTVMDHQTRFHIWLQISFALSTTCIALTQTRADGMFLAVRRSKDWSKIHEEM
jgi:hypothetical protein